VAFSPSLFAGEFAALILSLHWRTMHRQPGRGMECPTPPLRKKDIRRRRDVVLSSFFLFFSSDFLRQEAAFFPLLHN